MRWTFLLLLATLGGCAPIGILAAPEVISVSVLGRGVGDIAMSAYTGRDCSVVRLETGKTYCAPVAEATRPQPFCTRSLGPVTCWADPSLVPQNQREVGYTPPPTEDQLRYRALPWPRSIFF